jgi:nitrate/nitrite-specific signal transduction histidine kinase
MIYLINGLVKPIEHLRSTMIRVTEMDFNTHSTIHTRDEIGELSSSYNMMADTIQEYNKRLEQKIGERTEELFLSVAKLEESDRNLTVSISKVRFLSGLLPM